MIMAQRAAAESAERSINVRMVCTIAIHPFWFA